MRSGSIDAKGVIEPYPEHPASRNGNPATTARRLKVFSFMTTSICLRCCRNCDLERTQEERPRIPSVCDKSARPDPRAIIATPPLSTAMRSIEANCGAPVSQLRVRDYVLSEMTIRRALATPDP